jgi:hypothetical protein
VNVVYVVFLVYLAIRPLVLGYRDHKDVCIYLFICLCNNILHFLAVGPSGSPGAPGFQGIAGMKGSKGDRGELLLIIIKNCK